QGEAAPIRIEGDLPRTYTEQGPPGVFPGSRMFAIGGMLARVTPKRRVDVKLEEDREGSKGGAIALMGAVSPTGRGERVRVDLRDEAGQLRSEEGITDEQGLLRVRFDLS